MDIIFIGKKKVSIYLFLSLSNAMKLEEEEEVSKQLINIHSHHLPSIFVFIFKIFFSLNFEIYFYVAHKFQEVEFLPINFVFGFYLISCFKTLQLYL